MANTVKNRAKKKKSILLYAVALLMIFFVFFSYYAYQIVFTPNVDTKGKPAYLYIPTGATYKQVRDSLNRTNVVIDRLSFAFIAKLMDYPELVKPGRYELRHGATNRELVTMLRAGKQAPVKVTFNNIRLKSNLSEKLASYIEADQQEIDSLLKSPEYVASLGFDTTTIMTMFIPNTYEVYWNTPAPKLLERMQKEYEKFWNAERLAKAEKLGLTKMQVSTLASIVEAESQRNDERPRIAGVYLNRLRKGMLLQADPTVVFANQDFSIRRVLNIHLQKDSPYNTYKYKGLPPGPINLPSISAIDAVLNPEDHHYIYFCAREDFSGYHNFAVTEAEHLRNARLYQRALTQAKIMK